MKKALITGITGQDGSYLAEFLLNKGYEVHGVKRRSSSFNTDRINHLISDPSLNKNFHLHYGDLTDSGNLINLVQTTEPDEIYNLGAMSHVKVSFDMPEYVGNVDGLGTLRLLEAVRILKRQNLTKIYQASTSELYGGLSSNKNSNGMYDEASSFHPRSPYGAAKIYAFWITKNYREAHDMYACNGILFNHESPRRGETFVTRKITRGLAQIIAGKLTTLKLGNLDAIRDWGHAADYTEAMWLILQQEQPSDYVISTGVATSVRDFIKIAFNSVGIEIEFSGKGIDEIGTLSRNLSEFKHLKRGHKLIEIDPKYFRPSEVDVLIGDNSKARGIGWSPKISLKQLIEEMVLHDVRTELPNYIFKSYY